MEYRAITQKGLNNARFLLIDIAGAAPGETVSIICDDYSRAGAELLSICSKKLGLLPVIIDLSPYGTEYITAVERPYLRHVRGALEMSDIAFSFSPTYAWLLGGQKEFDAVHDGKRRFYTILGNGISEWDFDYAKIIEGRRRTPLLRAVVSSARGMRITSKLGTDLKYDISDGGIASIYDMLSLVPFFSEVAIVPKSGRVEGVAVIDGASQAGIRSDNYDIRGSLAAPMRLIIEAGKLKEYSIPDAKQKEAFEKFVYGVFPYADNVDELGLVTVTEEINDIYPWSWWGDGTHHSKSLHMALGNNYENRGDLIHASAHSDFDIYIPTLEIDGHIVFKDGVFDDDYIKNKASRLNTVLCLSN